MVLIDSFGVKLVGRKFHPARQVTSFHVAESASHRRRRAKPEEAQGQGQIALDPRCTALRIVTPSDNEPEPLDISRRSCLDHATADAMALDG
jgi:hypothetical protein